MLTCWLVDFDFGCLFDLVVSLLVIDVVLGAVLLYCLLLVF